MKHILDLIAEFLQRQRERTFWRRAARFMGMLVVFVTTYALILPAITLEGNLICENTDELHVHTEECYEAEEDAVETEQKSFAYTGSEIYVKLDVSGKSEISEETELRVSQITGEQETYATYMEKVNVALDEQAYDVMLYDIGLYDADGLVVALDEEAMIAFEFLESANISEETELLVLQLGETDEETQFIENVLIKNNEEIGRTEVSFKQQSLSVVALVKPIEIENSEESTEEVDEQSEEPQEIPEEEQTELEQQEEVSEELETEQEVILETEPEDEEVADESEPMVYIYEDESLEVQVTLPITSLVPTDAKLQVTPIIDTDDNYDELTEKAESAANGQACEVTLYDISFYTIDDEYIEVTEEATVSFKFKESIPTESESEMIVLHYEEEAEEPVELETVVVETDDNDEMTGLTFQTEGFSVFAMVKILPQGISSGTTLTAIDLGDSFDIDNLDGKRYVITNLTSQYMLSYEDDNANTNRRLDVSFTSVTDGTLEPIYWTFEGTDGVYKLRCGTQYLKLDGGNLIVVSSLAEASEFTIEKGTDTTYGNAILLKCGNYINLYGGANNPQGFAGYYLNDGGSQLKLYTDGYSEYELVTGLDGRKFAIINFDWDNQGRTAAIMNTVETDATQNKNILDAQTVTVSGSMDQWYFTSSADVTMWSFEATDSEGVYYIKDPTTNTYINIGGETDGVSGQYYDVTLSETKQEITVVAVTSTGKLYLKNARGIALTLLDKDVSKGFIGRYNTDYDLILAEKKYDATIFYDINLPSLSTTNGSKSWKTKDNVLMIPTIDSDMQEITADGTLLAKPKNFYAELGISGNKYKNKHTDVADVDNPYYGLYRMHMLTPGNTVPAARPVLDYEEYRFNGWIGTVDGVQYLFEPEAEFVYSVLGIQVSGKRITDGIVATELTSVTLPFSSVLEGSWTQVSAPAWFFINHTGTILDTEGSVTSRYSNAFLNGVASAWIFYAQTQVGKDGTFALEVNEKISKMFVNEELLDLEPKQLGTEKTQILIQTATTYNGENLVNNPEYAEANSKVVVEAALDWIRESDNLVIKISTGNGQTVVNNDQATSDNYSVRWYVLKEVNDGWHIDAVMTAVTKTLRVTKSIAGLTDDQIATLLQNFHMDLKIRGSGENETYMTLCTDQYQSLSSIKGWDVGYKGVPGQFQYLGLDSDTKTISWDVQLLVNEHVTIHERDYTVTNYVDKSYSIIDGQSETLYQGSLAGYDISVLEDNEDFDILGGTNKLIAFSNTYTEIGKASLSILKKDALTNTVLQNVEFTLKDSEGNIVQGPKKTDASGRVDFMNLERGTYTLEETKVEGYHEYPNTITISVVGTTENLADPANITVTETDSSDVQVATTTEETSIMYTISNTPEPNTLIVEKDFGNITPTQVAAIAENYQITLKEGDTLYKTLKISGDGLLPTYKSPDGLRYQWLLTGVGGKTFDVREIEYASDAYVDTIVEFERLVDGETPVLGVGESPPTLVVNRTEKYAQVSNVLAKAGSFTELKLKNTYTDEFTIYLHKIDEVTRQPLVGAVFKAYGSYEESTKPTDTFKYTDAYGVKHTLYYIGQTEPSDENGMAKMTGLKMENVDKTYAFLEVVAPIGYADPTSGSYQLVEITTDTITNNTMSVNITNQTKGVDLTIKKEIPESESDAFVAAEYPIKITISAPEASLRQYNRKYTYTIYNADGTQKQQVVDQQGTASTDSLTVDTYEFTVNLKKDEYVIVQDVPVNYIYTVQEVRTDTYYPVIDSLNGTGVFDAYAGTNTGKTIETTDDETINTVVVKNYSPDTKKEAVVGVEVQKVWKPVELAGTQIVLNLYKITNGDPSTAVLVGDPVTFVGNDDNDWKYTWSDLQIYADNGDVYDYFVSETIAGYVVNYDRTVEMLTVAGESVGAVHVTNGKVVITNSASEALPDTGGTGTQWYTIAGLVIMLAAAFMYIRKRTEERCIDGG